MRTSLNAVSAVFLGLLVLPHATQAGRLIRSTSLDPCMDNSQFTASLFNVTFTPDDGRVTVKMIGVSSISGYVKLKLSVIAYGYDAMDKILDPCALNLDGMCPMTQGHIPLDTAFTVDPDIVSQIPGIAYKVPDLDGLARIQVNSTDGGMVACVEAPLSNGITVNQHGVAWATAVVAVVGLIASAITSSLGHSNTAAHVASNAMSLFGYFQALSMFGMTAVHLPPIVSAWTQDFSWSMGIIRIGFMQKIFTWYIKSTGGTPSTLLQKLSQVSVQVLKRSTSTLSRAAMKGFREYAEAPLQRRADSTENASSDTQTVSGIRRVSFIAHIEITNFFMTGMAIFTAFLAIAALGVCAVRYFIEFAGRRQWAWAKGTKFLEFRNGWTTVLKGIMYRAVIIGYPVIMVLSLWEFKQHDSDGAISLAVFYFFPMLVVLAWASYTVIRIAQRSVSLHKNPAYTLYSDLSALNRWGFLYVQFRAHAYYFVVPQLIYILIKAMFVALGQGSGNVQAIAFLVIEVLYLVLVCWVRPWMDKRTNTFNISICVINFVNSIFLLIFTGLFHSPAIVGGVIGVVLCLMNAIFALILIVWLLLTSGYALFSKNPDIRYNVIRDDRGSFMKSTTHVPSSELAALGLTARGDGKEGSMMRDLDGDGHLDAHRIPLPPSTAGSGAATSSTSEGRGEKFPESITPVSPVSPVYHTPAPPSPHGWQQSGSVPNHAA